MRPWCVGEITTAHQNAVRCLPMRWPDFQLPDDDFIDNYRSHVTDLDDLLANGVDLHSLKSALLWFKSLEHIAIPEQLSRTSFTGFCGQIVHIWRKPPSWPVPTFLFEADQVLAIESSSR